ncbi:hypothetical protein TIFTF001_041179 [Ficus carica]|uniref:Retrotransposon gag domain-containing protein n=1 Tax=Ficus carica TaxID=3494 RepID=A0AA87Z2A1_FICCA|nr:hypothetical protein TIFTF001_041179 [Ficus carica]
MILPLHQRPYARPKQGRSLSLMAGKEDGLPAYATKPNSAKPNLATVVADLQQQLVEQQQETNRIRDQIAHLNQMPHANEVPPQENLVPPKVPPAPVKPAGAQAKPPMIQEDLLYERFRRMYYNRETFAAQQDEFNSMMQGSMTVLEAVKKFEQLASLCLELVLNETEKVRRMMKTFHTDIAKQVSAGSSPPTIVADCINQAIRVEYWINQDKEARAHIFKAKKEDRAVSKQSQPKHNQDFHSKG